MRRVHGATQDADDCLSGEFAGVMLRADQPLDARFLSLQKKLQQTQTVSESNACFPNSGIARESVQQTPAAHQPSNCAKPANYQRAGGFLANASAELQSSFARSAMSD